MAKNRNKTKNSTRDAPSIANQRLRSESIPNYTHSFADDLQIKAKTGAVDLREFEDRRTFNPSPQRSPATLTSSYTLVVPQKKIARSARTRNVMLRKIEPRAFVGFDKPNDVLVCVRRKKREEVLFAKQKTGRSGQKKPKFNLSSKFACRRK